MNKYNGLRILYIPHTSSPGSLATDHAYGFSTTLFRRWLDIDPNVKIYWPVPRNALRDQPEAFYKFTSSEIGRRIKFFDVDCIYTQVIEQLNFPKELGDMFRVDANKYFFDILFCEKPAIIAPFLNQARIEEVCRQTKWINGNIQYALDSDIHTHIARASDLAFYSGLISCDSYLFGCADECDIESWGQFNRKLQKHYSASIRKECFDKPRWIKQPSDLSEVKKVFEDWKAAGSKKGEGFRVHYGNSISSAFSYDKILEVMQRVRVIDPETKFVITTPSISFGATGYAPGEWAEVHMKCPRRDFYDVAIKSHVYVLWAANVGHGMCHGGAIEMARLGVLPIFQAGSICYPWPKNYKWAFKTQDELVAIFKYVKKNYNTPEVQNSIKETQDLLDRVYAAEGPDVIIDRIVNLYQNKMSTLKLRPIYDTVLNKMPSGLDFEQVLDYIKANTIKHIDIRAKKEVSSWTYGSPDDLRTFMMNNGWRDVGDVEMPVFERV